MKLVTKSLLRVVVALVGLALLFTIGYVGGWVFFSAIALLAVVALSEYYSSLQARGIRPDVSLGWLCALLILFVTQESEMTRVVAGQSLEGGMAAAGYEASADTLQLILLVLLLCVAGTMVAHFKAREGQSAIANTATTVFGVVYVGVLMSFVLRIRFLDVPGLIGASEASEFAHRLGALVLVVGPVWTSDGMAYLIGNLWGKHKLAPRVSPGKTWEGSIAGAVSAVVGAYLIGTLWLRLPAVDSIALGAIMGSIGQLGDLGKSTLKRDLGIKDFGSMFGPHGGVLDRFDAILFTMPVVYWYFWFLVMK